MTGFIDGKFIKLYFTKSIDYLSLSSQFGSSLSMSVKSISISFLSISTVSFKRGIVAVEILRDFFKFEESFSKITS